MGWHIWKECGPKIFFHFDKKIKIVFLSYKCFDCQSPLVNFQTVLKMAFGLFGKFAESCLRVVNGCSISGNRSNFLSSSDNF